MSENKTFTLEEIKAAYWAIFHKSGEQWFRYTSTERENEESTEREWKYFESELKKH